MVSQLSALCREPLWKGEVEYDRESGKLIGIRKDPNGRLHLWINPDAKGEVPVAQYAIGWDLAAGTGATPSCASVVSLATGEQVGVYVNPFIDPVKLAPYAVALCWLFKGPDGQGAYLGWEKPGPGSKFGQEVLALGYRNVYYVPKGNTNVGSWWSDEAGWMNRPATMLNLLTDYRAALNERKMQVRDTETLEDCLKFRYTTNGCVSHSGAESVEDPSGARQNHGDRTVAAAISWLLCKLRTEKKEEKEEEKIPVLSLAWRRQWHEDKERKAEVW